MKRMPGAGWQKFSNIRLKHFNMKVKILRLIMSISAMIVAFSCTLDKDSGFVTGNGLNDLYVYNVNTSVTKMITSSPDNHEWSYSFSPDTKKILYMDEFGMNEMNSDGSENRILTVGGSDPCYSPDGNKIAFTDEDKLYLMNTNGTDKALISNINLKLWYPVWLKDGSAIACSSDSGLCTVALDGSLDVLSVVGDDARSEWSYDSKEIFYSGYVSNSTIQIFRYNIASAKEYQVTYNDKYNFEPKCNPVKNEILFTSSRGDYGSDLVIANQDGTNPRVILHATRISEPCWSPQGDKIAFITVNSDVVVIDTNGENYEIINKLPGACMGPTWSNDGNYILYYRAIINM
jgi:Tol biopolymer transport system component